MSRIIFQPGGGFERKVTTPTIATHHRQSLFAKGIRRACVTRPPPDLSCQNYKRQLPAPSGGGSPLCLTPSDCCLQSVSLTILPPPRSLNHSLFQQRQWLGCLPLGTFTGETSKRTSALEFRVYHILLHIQSDAGGPIICPSHR